MKRPLAEIVADLERRIGGTRTRSMGKTVAVNEIELSRLLAAFRAAQEMAYHVYLSTSAQRKWDAAVEGDGG